LASHFYELEESLLKAIGHSALSKVLHSDKLRIASEDSLLDSIVEFGTDHFDLLGCLHTEYLSQTGMLRLLDSISREEMNDELWASLCHRLLLFVPSKKLPKSRFLGPEFALDSSAPFKGIIAHLTAECGGNVHSRGIVVITASSSARSACHQVVDYTWTDYWFTNGNANSWIQFDFKTRSISPSNYTIKSAGNGSHHLVKWSLVGSNDGTTWIDLDRRETNELSGNYIVKSYECASVPSSSFFRFIRLTQTGKNSSGQDNLMLANLELFGDMINASGSSSK
jgi:hypothetical protein